MPFTRILMGAALVAVAASSANAQPEGRSPVTITIAEGNWGTEGPPIVLLPQGGRGATIVLRYGATPEELFAAVSAVDTRRERAGLNNGSKPIIISYTRLSDRLPARLYNRLAGYLRSLRSAEVRQIGQFGALRAIDVQFRLRNPIGASAGDMGH